MFGEHSIFIYSVYSLFALLIAWHLAAPLVQLRELKRRLLSRHDRDRVPS